MSRNHGPFAFFALRCSQPVFWKYALKHKGYLISPEDMIFPNAYLVHCLFHRRKNTEAWVQQGGMLLKVA